MKVTIATIDELGGYPLEAVGSSEAEAKTALVRGFQQFLHDHPGRIGYHGSSSFDAINDYYGVWVRDVEVGAPAVWANR